jgi:Fe-S-cluster containining protein
LKENNGIIGGLMLFPDETELFPKEIVFPSLGVGFDKKDPSKPECILTYQVDSRVCPYVSEKNICKIYDRRPLIYRVFPLITMGEIGVTIADSEECLFAEKTELEKASLDSFLPITPKKIEAHSEWVFSRVMNTHWELAMTQQSKDQVTIGKFNLGTKEWVF